MVAQQSAVLHTMGKIAGRPGRPGTLDRQPCY